MKVFGCVKKVFFEGLTILSSFTSVSSVSCVSMNNQACKERLEIVNVASNNPIFYPFSIKTSKCSGNCNNINHPYSKISVPDIVKNLNVKQVKHDMTELMKQDIENGMKRVSVNVDQMQLFVITSNVGININANVNVKN